MSGGPVDTTRQVRFLGALERRPLQVGVAVLVATVAASAVAGSSTGVERSATAGVFSLLLAALVGFAKRASP